MENAEKNNLKENLAIISNAIQNVKANIKGQSFYYLLWGWLVTIASLFQYLVLSFSNYEHSYLPWVILMPLGAIITIIYSRNDRKQTGYETFLDAFLKHLWIIIGISFILVLFISFALKIHPTILTLFLAGIGTSVSGLSIRFRPLIVGGALLFIFSIFSIFFDDSLKLLVNAIAIMMGYLLPAYLLKRSK